MRNFKRIIYLVLALALASGCDLTNPKDPIIVPEVSDEFYVDMWERLDGPLGRELVVKIESIEPERCLNYRIDHFFVRHGNRLQISLNSIVRPNDCVSGEATVKADVLVGSLPNGNHGMDIAFRNVVVNSGQLSINNESYLLDMKTEHGIILLREELLRVPNDAIWGYVEAIPAVAEQFTNDLARISRPADGYRAGYYGHFTISTIDRKVFIYNQPSADVAKSFLYAYTGNESALKTLLNEYRQTYAGQLTIRLWNARGQEL